MSALTHRPRHALKYRRNYVFYASPPALECMSAYLEYCYRSRNKLDQLPNAGFLLTSGYAPIRVYRVSA